MPKIIPETEGILEFSEEVDLEKNFSIEAKLKKKRSEKSSLPMFVNQSIGKFEDDQLDIEQSVTSRDDIKIDKVETAFEVDQILVKQIKPKIVQNVDDEILKFEGNIGPTVGQNSSNGPKIEQNHPNECDKVNNPDQDVESNKGVVAKKIIKVKKKKLKSKIDFIETSPPITGEDLSIDNNDLYHTNSMKSTKSSEILESLTEESCLPTNQETTKCHVVTSANMEIKNIRNESINDFEKFQFVEKDGPKFDDFCHKSSNETSYLDQDFEDQLFEKIINLSDRKYYTQPYKLKTKNTRNIYDSDDDDNDNNIIGNIDYYLNTKLTKAVNKVESPRNKVHLNEEAWDDEESDQELNHTRSKTTNHRFIEVDKNKGEALMDQVRREKNLRSTRQRRNSMYQPKRRGDTDDKVAEKTKHVKALIDRQVMVVDNIRLSVQKFAELEILIKDLKAESLEQKAELENLEDLFDAVYNKYKNETKNADNAIRMQKKDSKLNLNNKVELILKEVFTPQDLNGQFIMKTDKVNNSQHDFQLPDARLESVKTKLKSREHGKNENFSFQNNENFDKQFLAVKEFNEMFPVKSKKNDLHLQADDGQNDAVDVTSLSAEEFINRIKSKYAIEQPIKNNSQMFNSCPTRDSCELLNNKSNLKFGSHQRCQTTTERKPGGRNHFE